MTSMTHSDSPIMPIPSWSTGTDAEIVQAVARHYAGEINLREFWSVGDERTVYLHAMDATSVRENHEAQTITMVLMNAGGKELAFHEGGYDECAFIVGQKNSLKEYGSMNSSSSNTGGWDSSDRRTWCNEVYYNAIPETLRPIFKQHYNRTADGSGNTYKDSTDYFALPAETEVYGGASKASGSAESSLTQFEYYESALNKIKLGGNTGSAYYWYMRSPVYNNSALFCAVDLDGNRSQNAAGNSIGLAPFGVI